MEENKQNKGIKGFFLDIVRGMAIGVAFIIPGFSGGSIAAILGIYEKLVGAIAGIFKEFKKSILTLLPIGIGMILGVISLLFPLSWALGAFPIPTVCIFVGLAIGGLPSITDNCRGSIKFTNIAALLAPLAIAAALSFLPVQPDVNLLSGLNFADYILLLVIGLVGSSALVVPGISGSMLLLIFGYYNPIVSLLTDHLLKGRDVGQSVAVLCTVGGGIIVGFFAISLIMKWLLANCPRGTYFAILGFILGSIPTVFVSTAKESGLAFSALMPSVWYWVVSAALLIIGFAISFSLVLFAKKKSINEK